MATQKFLFFFVESLIEISLRLTDSSISSILLRLLYCTNLLLVEIPL